MERTQSKRKKVERVLIPQHEAAKMLGVSQTTIWRMREKLDLLTPVRLTGPRGRVWYRADEIMQLAEARS